MADESWRDLEGTWDRLRWSRKRKFERAIEFAQRVGEKPGTYRTYERQPGSSKWTLLDHQNAARFARALGVRWEWLLLGEGEPYPGDTPRDRIIAALDQATPDQQARVADAVEALLKVG